MKKFSIPCSIGLKTVVFDIYIDDNEIEAYPLQLQADRLQQQSGGIIPFKVINALIQLKKVAKENNLSFEELCVYALGSAQTSATDAETDCTDRDTLSI